LSNIQPNFTSSNYCLSIIFKNKDVKKRTQIIKFLNKKGIGTSIYYPKPVPHMTYYKKKYKYNNDSFKNASKISYNSIALPVGPHINIKHLDFMIKNIKKVIR